MSEPLAAALATMRTAVAQARFPPASPAAAVATRLIQRLDDYLIARVRRPDAPLLAVVGGPTGAGKSTLVNSIVSAPASATGALRPTTQLPVLVSHPDDAAWFAGRQVLPGFRLVNSPQASSATPGPARDETAIAVPDPVQVISAPALWPGLALLDAPDIDSVVGANRALASRLLAAADLWLFVTTAARYADAAVWQLLATARHRGSMLCLVLDRVPAGAEAEISAHLTEMLGARGLGRTRLFVIPETSVDRSGLLPEACVTPIREWLRALAGEAAARVTVIRTTARRAARAAVADCYTLAQAADQPECLRIAARNVARAIPTLKAPARNSPKTSPAKPDPIEPDPIEPDPAESSAPTRPTRSRST